MKLYRGQLTDTYNGTFTPQGFDRTQSGNYITTYASPSRVRESGVTKVRSKPIDMSQYLEAGRNRHVSAWSHINGSTQVPTASGSSVWVGFQVAPAASGATWYTVGKLRTAGTSVSGVSGTHVTTLATVPLMPFWRLEFCGQFKHATADMTVDYVVAVE